MTSFPTGPVHNAVRRMTELIDLENLEGYFDEHFTLETQNHQPSNNQEFDAITEENTDSQSSW